MTPPSPPHSAPSSAQYARVWSPEEYDRDPYGRRSSCLGERADIRRWFVIVSVLLITIATLALTGHSAIVAWALFAILAGCFIGLIVSFVSVRRELRDVEEKIRDAKRPPPS